MRFNVVPMLLWMGCAEPLRSDSQPEAVISSPTPHLTVEVEQEPPPAELEPELKTKDVRRLLSGDVTINWTRMVLEVKARSQAHGVEAAQKTIEQSARSDAEPRLRTAAMQVKIDNQTKGIHLASAPETAEAFEQRIAKWVLVETRYFMSGAIEVDGELSLQELFKPWTMQHAHPRPPLGPVPKYTGVLLDARGIPLEFAYAPKLLAPSGIVLYDGSLWTEDATDTVPAIYVQDPEHPAMARIGALPLSIKIERAVGADLVVSQEGAMQFKAALSKAKLLGEGRLIVLVDPE